MALLQPKWTSNASVTVPTADGKGNTPTVEYNSSINPANYTIPYLNPDLDGIYQYPQGDSLTNMMMIYFDEVTNVFQQSNSGSINVNYLSMLGGDSGPVPPGNMAYQDMLQQAQMGALMNKLVGQKGSTISDYLQSGVKNYERTSSGIWMLYPNSIKYDTGANWAELNSEPNAIGLLGTQSSEGGLGIGNMTSTLAREGAIAGLNATSKGTGLGNAITKSVQNTYNDMTFNNMQRRKFQFSWTLVPRNMTELYSIDLIIRLMRFHASPSYDDVGAQGTYLTFPGHIDVEWYTKNGNNYTQNAWLPKISTCVILSVDTDYSPNNQYSFLANSGAPAQIDLALTISETQPLLKNDVARGF